MHPCTLKPWGTCSNNCCLTSCFFSPGLPYSWLFPCISWVMLLIRRTCFNSFGHGLLCSRSCFGAYGLGAFVRTANLLPGKSYISFFVICSLRIIELQYDWSEEQEMANALFCLMELMFVTALLVLEIIAWLNRRKPVRNNEFEINAWRMLSYLLVFFLLGGLMNVIPGMTELIQKEDVGKAMIALLVISYPLEILNIFWNAIENDGRKNDSRNTENEIDRKLDDLCVKVQNSLDDSQQKIVESVRDINEKISKVTSDTPCMSFRRTDSTYEFKVVMRRQNHRK